jgi:hypothetical protein
MLTECSNSSSVLYDTGVLAHQGGWDEILLVAGPILVIVLVLWKATRRAERIVAQRTAESGGIETTNAE